MIKDSWMFNYGNVIEFPIPEGVQLPIYVIGDSHVRVLVEVAPYIFKSSQTDIEEVFESKTAYYMGNNEQDLYLKEALRNIPEGSQVLLSFGEIDCRHYVPVRAIKNNTSLEHEVDEIIKRYTKNCVRVLKEKFKVIILGSYTCPDDYNHENSFTDILTAKTLFNQKIKKYCNENGLLFIPIFWKVLEEKWDECKLDFPHYFNDSSHLGGCMIPTILNSMIDFQWKI